MINAAATNANPPADIARMNLRFILFSLLSHLDSLVVCEGKCPSHLKAQTGRKRGQAKLECETGRKEVR
jgi:hypothetical protein